MGTEQYIGESLGEFQINKPDEYMVSGNILLGTLFDEMTLNVFKVQENGGRGELLEQHTRRYPVAPTGGKFNLMRKFRNVMLERTFMEFEKTNNHGILFSMQ
ncbi:hypothetical protein ACTFR8_24375 [Bacillus cereus group sp. MYBK15-3]|uniref:hypothetical protein n=1 Tax=Bacillus cereus group TaxID=86661 RepID=UPI00187AD4C7|nr:MULTISPECIES: hypothetical protein [Bacillus cereus group]MBE7114244.1 hypothetical protein [Bacillus paranthracis]MBE7154883.1 hypothetical protein [Bacillus paranthracis]MBX9158737.1 hypothetical protein [Bacillus cereus]